MEDNNKDYKSQYVGKMMQRRFLISVIGTGAVGILVYAMLLSGTLSSSNITVTEAEASNSAIIIGKLAGEPKNPLLPLQHVDKTLLSSSSSTKIIDLLSKVDADYDPRIGDNPSQRFVIGDAEARAILILVPFSIHDSETFPGTDAYSTNVEVDGNYYYIVVFIPKAQ